MDDKYPLYPITSKAKASAGGLTGMATGGSFINSLVETLPFTKPVVNALGFKKEVYDPAELPNDLSRNGEYNAKLIGEPLRSIPKSTQPTDLPTSIKAYRADPTGKFGGKEGLETLPIQRTFSGGDPQNYYPSNPNPATGNVYTNSGLAIQDLYRHARLLGAAQKYGYPTFTPEEAAAFMLKEGRTDLGHGSVLMGSKREKDFNDILSKTYNLAAEDQNFLAAINAKKLVADRLGISLPEAWNGTGKNEAGQTGKDYARNWEAQRQAALHPKNKELLDLINRAMNEGKQHGLPLRANRYRDEIMQRREVPYAKGGSVKNPIIGINVASDRKAGMSYADLIVDGHKTHESRNSDSLRPYVGKRVSIVRTGEGAAKAIGEVTVGEPLIVSKKKFRSMEPQHLVPEGSAFDIKTETKHLYPMHDPVRYDEERDVGHGIIARKVIHKADGGTIQGNKMNSPSIAQMRLQLNQRQNPDYMDTIGIEQAVDMDPKTYISPNPRQNSFMPVGGVADSSGLPVGGIDQDNTQQGQQMMAQQPDQDLQPNPSPQGTPAPEQEGTPQQKMGNMLSMTPQGQALQAMGNPPGMARGGKVGIKNIAGMRASMMMLKSPTKKLAKGGDVESPTYKPTDNPKRILFHGKGHGQTKGIVVPRHMWEGSEGKRKVEGMKEINKARAEVYGDEKRDPLNVGQVGRVHKKVLDEHFAKPIHEQLEAETEAIGRLRKAKHIGHGSNTLDESEKLDTVRHERDEKGRAYVGYASKGVAGHSLYTSGHGKNSEHHILNTCPGQTTGCGGGHDKNGVVDSSKGTCFAPNAESQYVNAAIRRACHEQAKHDPKMTRDWILAHTGSLRHVSNQADKKNLVTLFRPNVVDETDVSSRHVIKGLNKQRKAEGKPNIVANSYGKTNELHDPENGYHVTHSNVGPKTKHGAIIADNVDRDKQRIRSTIHAADASGKDFVNEEGNKTPPKGSYMVTNVKRNSPMSKEMEKHITHAKYWSAGRHEGELSKEEKEEGEEGHFGGNGKPTSPEKAHYGHVTHKGLRYDYQKQHILHPRLVQVGHNDDGSPHMIPTDSRFKDEEFLPKNRFKTKNGKNAGAILMTTPTESTSNHLHHSSFTHDVNKAHIEHAKKNNGEYEIDSPAEQAKAQGKEYVPPQPINIVRKAGGGSISGMNKQYDDDFNAFPEQNFMAQHHHANRVGVEDISEVHPSLLKRQED